MSLISSQYLEFPDYFLSSRFSIVSALSLSNNIELSVHIVDLDITCFPFSESNDFLLSDAACKIRIKLPVTESLS